MDRSTLAAHEAADMKRTYLKIKALRHKVIVLEQRCCSLQAQVDTAARNAEEARRLYEHLAFTTARETESVNARLAVVEGLPLPPLTNAKN